MLAEAADARKQDTTEKRRPPPRAKSGEGGSSDRVKQTKFTASSTSQSPRRDWSPGRAFLGQRRCVRRHVAFLALILPQEGPYAAFTVEKDREARKDPIGTPSAQRRYGRTKRNVRCTKALWRDIDAGPSKPCPDWKAAARAVGEFCRATGLPEPLIVLSGLGIHAYWPLVQTLDPETWERYARGLKALCVMHGLQADPARTADITSVLRTPGTHHRKAGTRLVQCGELVGPYALEQFAILLSVGVEATPKASNATPKASSIVNELGPIPLHLVNRPVEGVKEKLHRSLRQPSLGTLVAERCEQVGALRDKKGNLPEPSGTRALAWSLPQTMASSLRTNGPAVTRDTPSTKRRSVWSVHGGCPARLRADVFMN